MRGAIYHVMSRGNRKASIFEDDADRRRFEVLLGETMDRYRLLCHSYCLMGNHYHAVIECSEANVSAAMHWLNGVFAQYSNRRHERTGHLLQGRFKSVMIGDDAYLRAANTYVVLNPVRAGLVDDPSEWRWSSYRASVGIEAQPSWLDLDWLRWVFGGRTLVDAQRSFKKFVGASSGPTMPDENLVFGGLPLLEDVRSEIGAVLHQSRLPREYRAMARPSLGEIFPRPLPKSDRNARILRAHVVHGYRLAEIAASLFVHPNTISRIVKELRMCGADESKA
jgi:REP element-mobilizing transposase RayT